MKFLKHWNLASLFFILVSFLTIEQGKGFASSPTGWTQLTPNTSPSVRNGAAMAYDPNTGLLILFGGFHAGTYYADTWSWNGTTWTNVTPANPSNSPSPRAFTSMDYDPKLGHLILFGGGIGNGVVLNETWAWDGTTNTWTNVTPANPANSPSPREFVGLTLDPTLGQLLLFGGEGTDWFNDTWTWDGSNWIELTPPNPIPLGRAGAAMAFDAVTSQVLLFGGQADSPYNDTWSWNGSTTTWTNVTPTNPADSPAPRSTAMAYDPATAQLILFGGAGTSVVYGDTWTWTGSVWMPLSLANSPSSRYFNSMSFDSATGQLISFGGNTDTGYDLNDTWNWDFVPATITSVAPNQGPTSGGTVVTLTGTNFNGAQTVNFGGISATFSVNSNMQITAVSPVNGAGTVDVTVTTAVGTSPTGPADHFTYVAPPIVSGISPNRGSTNGGTSVTITGSGFTGATGVSFGGVSASFIVNSSTQITATSPSQAVGTVDVTVTTVGGPSATSPADQFTYQSMPAVTGISPNQGPTSGGTTVIVTGSGFTGATAVKFGSTSASFTVNSDTKITVTSPAHAVGTLDVTVTTVAGTSATSSADQFTYAPIPTVFGISPNRGPKSGGTTVIIAGSGFTGATTVHFGSTSVNCPVSCMVNSDSQITVTSPAHVSGTVDVTVTTAGGTSSTNRRDQFTYR